MKKFAVSAVALAVIAFALLQFVNAAAIAARVGEPCGGATDIQCDTSLWCERNAGTCAVKNAPGTCIKLQFMCEAISLPVCGCDGKDYGNDCERQGKAQKDHDGFCKRQ